MKKTLTIDLLRHGEPHGGDILRGRVNPELTETGWNQMRQSTSDAALNSASQWHSIITSPLARCRAFAETFSGEQGIDCRPDDQWQEIDYGDWDGLPIARWRELAADQFKAFRQDESALKPPGGENFVDFRDRVLAALQSLGQYPDGAHLLLVTHGGVMRVVIPWVLGMPLNRSFPLHIPFACLSRLTLRVGEEPIKPSDLSLVFHNRAGFH